jgi:hypothetical protein
VTDVSLIIGLVVRLKSRFDPDRVRDTHGKSPFIHFWSSQRYDHHLRKTERPKLIARTGNRISIHYRTPSRTKPSTADPAPPETFAKQQLSKCAVDNSEREAVARFLQQGGAAAGTFQPRIPQETCHSRARRQAPRVPCLAKVYE